MPINVATGEVEIARDDFFLPGRVPIKWTRRYRSDLLGVTNSPLGTGWTTSWFPKLKRMERTWQFVSSQGDQNVFPDPDGRVERGHVIRLLGAFLELVRDSDGYVVTHWDVESGAIVRFVFASDKPVDNPPLVGVESVSGDGVDVTNEAPGRVKGLRQRIEKRTVVVNYSANGRILSLDLMTNEGVRTEIVRYEYDTADRLSVVYDRRGLANRYEYDANSRVSREILKDGAVYSYRYDDVGRCTHFSGLDRFNEKRLRFMDSANRTMVTNSYGKTSIYEWLPSRHIVGETDPSGCQRRTEFDEFNRIVAKVDAAGSTTRYTFDENGNRDSITDPLGHTYKFTFNGYHQPISVTDPLGNIWHRGYDVKHRLVSTRNPLGARRTISYDEAGNPSVITDPLGSIRRLRFEDGMLREMTDLMDHAVSFKWDDFGRVIERIGSIGERTTIRYDPVGNPIEVALPNGSRLRATYDGGDNLCTFTNAKGDTTRFRYGPCRRLLERIDPLERAVRYLWGTEPDRIDGIINEKGESLTYFRDDQGRVVRERSFDGRERCFERDAVGRCSAVTNGNGDTIELRRDRAGRVLDQLLPDGTVTSFEYDELGRIVAGVNSDIPVRFEYDDAGRLLRETQGDHWVENSYDAAGALILITTSLGHQVRYELDPNGRLRKVSVANNQSIIFERDARGLEIARQMPGAMRLEQRYDSVGRLVEQRVGPRSYKSLLSAEESHILAGHEVIKRNYGYDGDSLILSITDDRWGQTNYTYDPAERVLHVLREQGENEGFEYDATDNFSRVFQCGSETGDHTCTYSLGNRLVARGQTRFEYDPEGRLVRKSEGVGGARQRIWKYSWDPFGQLRKICRPDGTEWEYKYDAFGRRVVKKGAVTNCNFLWSGDSIVQELPDVSPTVAWIMKPGSFVPLAKVQEGSLYPIITDHLGTPREVLDSSGKLVWTASLTAWGQVGRKHSTRPQDECPIRFQGQWFDEESGLHYNRFRFYDPALGRFLSPDPVGVAGGENLYRYVVNPIGGVDPLGLQESGCIDPVAAEDDDETLYRRGEDKESAARLGRKAAEAEAQIGIHGVSTSTTPPKPGEQVSAASRSDVETVFPVEDTPTRNDPNHKTVVLPKPVTPQVAADFNRLFGRQ